MFCLDDLAAGAGITVATACYDRGGSADTENHRGSASSSTDAWLNAISAEVCVLSVGANPYGHPTTEALGRLHAHGIGTRCDPRPRIRPVGHPIYDQVVGDVVISTSGSTYSVNGDQYSAN